jgi:hypothetical protein
LTAVCKDIIESYVDERHKQKRIMNGKTATSDDRSQIYKTEIKLIAARQACVEKMRKDKVFGNNIKSINSICNVKISSQEQSGAGMGGMGMSGAEEPALPATAEARDKIPGNSVNSPKN